MKTQVDALVRAGAQVEVVGPLPWVPPGLSRLGARWRRYAETPSEAMDGPVRVMRPRYIEFPRGNYWAAPHRAFARLARRNASARPDVVHAHFAYPGGVAAAAAASAWGIPAVLTLHGSDVNFYPNVNALTRRRFRAAVREVGAVIAVSDVLADRTETLAGRRPRVMPIGIDRRPYETLPDRVAARRELGLPGEAFLVLFVGNLLVEKGIRELLQALSSLQSRGVRGVFVGEGPLQAEAQDSGVVETTGLRPNRQIPLYMAASDVLVLPSYSEGMPTVLVEAGAACLPVAATPVGGIPQLLGSDRGLLFSPRSPSDISNAIAAVLDDPAAARERSSRLAAYVRDEYDVDRNARSLIGLYERLRERRDQGHDHRNAPAGAA